MTDRFPLIANPTTKQIEELAPGDNLNLQNSGIVGATTIAANKFVGPLEGNATSANILNDAANITAGTISSSRLSGNYNINVTSANILNDAANITAGTISSSRLTGYYPIGVDFATNADGLLDAGNIFGGILPVGRLTGVYNINITGIANTANYVLKNSTQDINILGNAGTATTATNLSGGDITGSTLNVTGLSSIKDLNVTGITTLGYSTIKSANIGIATIGYSTITSANIGIATIGFGTFKNAYVGIATIGFGTFKNAYIGILTVTTIVSLNGAITGVKTISSYDATLDFINSTTVTAKRVNTGIASITNADVGIATVGFGTFTNAYVGILTANLISGNFSGILSVTNANIGIATIGYSTITSANIGIATINTATIGFGTFTNLRVSGVSTLGYATITSANIGIATIGYSTITSANIGIATINTATIGFGTFTNLRVSGISTLGIVTAGNIFSTGIITATSFSGSGINLVGIVTQITVGTGLTLTASQEIGKGTVQVGIRTSIGKTIFVSYQGSDTNTGLLDNDAKKTIKAAAAMSFPGDTIKVFPGTYVENNPIILPANVSVEGAELRNCLISAQNSGLDLFQLNNGCHLTDLSFVGAPATNGAAVVTFVPLSGVATDRFFDGSRLINLNLDFIANETVGYLTSTQYKSPAFNIGIVTQNDCKDDIKSILQAVCYDITRGGNSKSVGAGKSYYTNAGALQHITGTDINGYSVKDATIEAIQYAAGICRAVINNGTWGAKPVGSAITVTNALYNNTTGIITITASSHGLLKNDAVKVVGLGFTCPSGIATLTYPNGSTGYIFTVRNVVGINTFEVIVGQSTLPHTYVSGGTVQKFNNYQNNYTQVKDLSMQPDSATGFNNSIASCANVVSAIYSAVGVVTTIVKNGLSALGPSGITTTYPGNAGIGTTNPNDPSFSPGVGVITKGPYIRNCTNFIQNSIGLKVNGFDAEPGDQIDNGVQGSMSVDSYTQYNQGGIGVSITNCGYAQLVSIFTICDDIAIFTGSGGQCDLTNSNTSFGTYGLVSNGVGDNTSKSLFRYTGIVNTEALDGTDRVVISGVGNNRPHTGQAIYFDTLYYTVDSIRVTDGGSNYTSAPTVIIDAPVGPNGIRAEASASIENGVVTSINIISTGNQYLTSPGIAFTDGGGSGATATAILKPFYYKVQRATLPSAGITTVILTENLNNTVSFGTTAYISRLSLQVASTISFEYVGAGNTIEFAKPSKGGITQQDNEVVKLNGGEIVYTSTDQSGNFRIGEDVIINQLTGTISGRAFSQSLLNTVTPLVIALGK